MKIITHQRVRETNIPKKARRLRWIYILLDPDTNTVRYVGQTAVDVRARVSDHLTRAKQRNTSTRCWIHDLQQQGKQPIAEIVDVFYLGIPDPERHTEKAWMKRLLLEGAELTNSDHCFRTIKNAKTPD